MKRGILIVLMAFLGLTSVMAAQKVTLKCREVALKEIFARITKQTGLTVAYSSQVLNVDTKISIDRECGNNRSLGEIATRYNRV